MAVLKILTGADNKILRTKSAEVKKIDKKIKKLVADMTDTMLAVSGLGIAAPQVGVNLKIFIARLNSGTKNELIASMINAKILSFGESEQEQEEGCLSVPGMFGIVKRRASAVVEYADLKGQKNVLNLSGLNARIIQHENDHLDGVLIIDKLVREISSEELKGRDII